MYSPKTYSREHNGHRYTFVEPWLYPKQAAAFYGDARYAVTEASTKSGKTHGALAWLYGLAFNGQRGHNYWWVAPTYRQTKIAFRRLKRALPENLYKSNESELTLTLPWGSVLWFLSGENPDHLYGEDVFGCVMDEAARCREAAYVAVRTTLTATKGPIRIITNVKGRKNWTYKMARKAEAGEPGMVYNKITAADAIVVGILDQAEVDDARRHMPEAAAKELFDAEAAEDIANPFGFDHIKACVAPLSVKEPIVWGWDLAKSVDWTVGTGLDEDGFTCRFERFQKPWPETKTAILAATGDAYALVDSTGVGDPVLADLQKANGGTYEGFLFSSRSKQQLMDGLAVSIQQIHVRFPEGPIEDELESFEYEYTRTGVLYCVMPNTKILTEGLRWINAAELTASDKLLAFDENPPPGHKTRRWRSTVVTHAGLITRPCYRLRMEDGTELVASKEHRWLVEVGGKLEWRRTDQLRQPHTTSISPRFAPSQLVRLLDVWADDLSYEAGYLAAAFDGEGSIQQTGKHGGNGHNARLTFAQLENQMADQTRTCLRALGFEWAEYSAGKSGVINFAVKGRRQEFLRFLGQVRPRRLLSKFDAEKLGTLEKKQLVAVKAIEYLGELDVVALGTTTGTFVADGFASHNSAPEGMHDDCVCSLALADWARQHMPAPLEMW